MERAEYYLKELNVLCIAICCLIVGLYWLQQLTPNIYAALQVIIENLDPQIFIDEINPEEPTDFVHKILSIWL